MTDRRRRTAALLLAATLGAGSLAGQDAPGRPPVIVHLGDGSSQPLSKWNLVYDYLTWKPGSSQLLAQPTTRIAGELLTGKKSYPVAGTTLELAYREVPREIEISGRPQRVLVPVAARVTLRSADGKKTEFPVEAPHRDLLLPGAGKNANFVPRSLDLVGETLTGTKRSFCVLTYTSLVECAANPAEQVVKLEFP